MMRTVRTNPIVLLMLAALVGGNVPFALAVDGVVLIDQNRALAGNVTPGDAPGFPVTISRTGSYRLSGNLAVPDENTTAIQITADGVTLDLNGFSILGPTVCSVLFTTCTPAFGTGIGVGDEDDGIDGTTVVNGRVQGMGRHGVQLADNARIENVHAVSNGQIGILAGSNSRVSGNQARSNLSFGIAVSSGSTVSGNTIRNNAIGISASDGSIASGNTALGNGIGLALSSSTGYTHNVLSDNSTANVIGGVSLGQNLCDGVIC